MRTPPPVSPHITVYIVHLKVQGLAALMMLTLLILAAVCGQDVLTLPAPRIH